MIKINSEVAGKDKIARLIQYGCRALWDSLNAKDDAQLLLVSQLKSLEYILSSFRKCKFDNWGLFMNDATQTLYGEGLLLRICAWRFYEQFPSL